MTKLTEKETARLRELHWKLLEAQTALNEAANEVGLAHGCNIEKEQWNVTRDFRGLVKVK